MEKIIYRLRQARVLNGLSLREAAKGLGISHEWLRKNEKGETNISSEQLVKFANFYKVKTDYLFPNKNRPVVNLSKIEFHRIKKGF